MENISDIVKVRHKKAGKPVGILNENKGKEKFTLVRYLPRQELNFFIEHYWIVKWNLDQPYLSETLPHPSVHIVFEKDRTEIVGVMKGKFSRFIEGNGKVFGIKFKPGGLFPFVNTSVSFFTNKRIKLNKFFNADVKVIENSLYLSDDDEEMINIAENFLSDRLPGRDKKAEQVNKIIEFIISHKEIIKVDDVVKKLKINKRTLQRLFNKYVGVSPKWVIKRYRLHEAADKLSEGKKNSLVEIALNLGYFDQAHFIKDFKSIVGKTPSEYLKMIFR